MKRVALVAIVALVLLAGTLAARGAIWYQTGDFFCLYQGAHALVAGTDPYDERTWQAATGGLYPDIRGGSAPAPCPGRYGYPLWTAVLLIPIGALPLEVASTAWMSLSIGAVILGIAAAWRAFEGTARYAALFAVLVVASQPFWILLLSGQITGLVLGIAGIVAWCLAMGRERTGAVALLLLAVKPQTVGITIPAVIVQAARARRWRLVGAALVATLVMVALPFVFVAGWPVEWLGEVGGRRLRVITQMPTAWGFASQTLGDPAWGAVLVIVVIALTAFIARRHDDPVTVFVLSLPLSLLATPYAWSYDYLVLAIPWGFTLARAARSDTVPRALLVAATVVVACGMPWALYALSFTRGEESLSAFVPALTAVVAAFAARVSAPPDVFARGAQP